MHTHEAIGKPVIYVDELGREHNALVTACWGNEFGTKTSINLVYVSGAEDQSDQYGRQIARGTSVVPQQQQSAHGRYYRTV